MPVALITGATAGLGAEFARQLAAQQYNLVLVARDVARLEATREQLSADTGVDVEVLPADLGSEAGCDAVRQRIATGDIDLLINNAGMGSYRPFGVGPWDREVAQLDLNVRAVMALSYAAVQTMTTQGSGRIINVSSVAGFVPRGANVTYSASKAWVTMFSEALHVQLASSGVTVTAVCPGFTHTEFHERAQTDMSHVPQRMWLAADVVVREGLADAFAGKPLSVPSRQYQALVLGSRLLPRPLLRTIMARRKF